MEFDAKQWLTDHDNDPEKALSALAAKWNEEGKAAERARKQRDQIKSERDAVQDKLTDAEKRAAPEGAAVLTGDDAAAWQTFKERGGLKAFDEAEQIKQERDTALGKIARKEAAEQVGVSEADLAEWLGGRTLAQGKVKGEDGKDADAYGIAEGEEFKPLTGYATLTALAGKSDKPADKPPLPTGQRGGPAKPASIAQEQNRRAASHLRPKTN